MVDNRQTIKHKLRWRCVVVAIIVALILSLFASVAYAFFGLPRIDNLESLQLVAATQVFDINGQLIAKLFEENRVVVSLNNMSPYLLQATIANEDSRFYSHAGVDPIGILRAVWANLRSGGIVQGGSTLTQQLAKNMFLTQEQTLIRKIKEALLALVIEQKFSKEEILQAYLNQSYYGEGAYGVEAGAQVYFGKHASELDLAQSALLAGIARGPNIYSPYIDLNAALNRRAVVLAGMVKEGYIQQYQADQAQQEPIILAGKKKRVVQASYFLDYIAKELSAKYGEDRVYKGGLQVYTTLEIKTQQAAEAVLGTNQGAVLALDPKTGYIKAMVGGRDYAESQINRVIAEVRQPGSAFKPFVYGVALNQGLAANYIIIDERININGYSPENYDKKYRGPITLKKALRQSVNTAAVKLGRQVGMDNVLNLAKSAGITTLVAEDNHLATALGGLKYGVNLMELTTAYTSFANGGVLSKPVAILKVLDENGQVLENATLSQQSILQPEIAYILTDMLQSVVQTGGTGTPANIGRPQAGKTGTTDDYITAWYIGYTPDLLVGIYVGNDNREPVPLSGTQVAGLWGTMMAKVVADTPPSDFPVPANVVAGVPICANSGKRATRGCPETEYSAFIRGTEPASLNWWDRLTNNQPEQGEQAPEQGKQQKRQQPKSLPRWLPSWPRLPGF